MDIKNDLNYLEGKWFGQKARFTIQKTYGSLEAAIKIKTDLVNEFETKFGYSRVMEVTRFDPNYSFNVGFLDALLELQEQNDD